MRSLKSNGGLTRGTGFKKTQRAIWLLSMPISSTCNLKCTNLLTFILKQVSNTKVLQMQEFYEIMRILEKFYHIKTYHHLLRMAHSETLLRTSLLMKE